MRTLDSLLDEYEESHRHPTNLIVHKICVPTIMFSLLGMLWAIPTPMAMQNISPLMNWSVAFVAFCFLYYIILSFKYFLLVAPLVILMLVGNYFLAQTDYLLVTNIGIFVVSWVFQLWGHKVEGKKPSFFKDLLFLLIGPLFVIKKVLRIA
jgi:uncharacterized membrane protein YGL010W